MKGKGKGTEKGGKSGFFNKGDGKGGKGPGNFQSNFSGKSGGKGYQGACWKCGVVGHKAIECRSRGANAVEQDGDEHEEQVGGLWTIGGVDSFKQVRPIETCNRFAALSVEEDFDKAPVVEEASGRINIGPKGNCRKTRATDLVDNQGWVDETFEVLHVGGQCETKPGDRLTRKSSVRFNVAQVQKPLVSAARVVSNGNRIVMSPETSFIENIATGEKMQLRVQNGVYVFDVMFGSGEEGTLTLDSGAGVNVWPEQMLPQVPVEPAERGLRMIAADGTKIANLGTKTVDFRGFEVPSASVLAPGFRRQA